METFGSDAEIKTGIVGSDLTEPETGNSDDTEAEAVSDDTEVETSSDEKVIETSASEESEEEIAPVTTTLSSKAALTMVLALR